MSNNRKSKHKFIDYLFWIIFILFTNPGGIQQALGIYEFGIGGTNLNDYLFVLLLFLYIILPHRQIRKTKDYRLVKKYLFIFSTYYFLFFIYLTPIIKDTNSQNIIFNLIKSRWVFYSISLFFITYKFFLHSYKVFFKLLAYSSVIILLIFFISVITGLELLPYEDISRGFIDMSRYILLSYGLMPLLVPIGVILVVYKFNIDYRKVLLTAAIMMFLAWLISLTRRHIFGAFIYVFLATILYNYIKGKKLISFIPIFRIIFASSIIIVVVYFSFPKYIDGGIKTFETTVYVIQHGETEEGHIDKRLGFNRTFIVDLFKDNPIVGTGFSNNWRTSAGDKAGFEASDYPLLSAFAMTGIVGILLFLPIYILLIKYIYNDIRMLRRFGFNNKSFEDFILILFIIVFTFHLLEYMNWFIFVSNPNKYWFPVYIAMYLASRRMFYNRIRYERV